MPTLRRGDYSTFVRTLQAVLNTFGATPRLRVDGDFGELTERAVEDFQERHDLLVDGIVGPVTWDSLGAKYEPGLFEFDTSSPVFGVTRIECDVYDAGHEKSYRKVRMRSDISEKLRELIRELHLVGAKFHTSGGLRNLNANVSASRSAKSFHYCGRAVDLYVGGAMASPDTDPYLVEPDGPRHWTVWARAAHGSERLINAWSHSELAIRPTRARVVNLTDLFSQYGFQRIGARSSYPRLYMSSEWWHFQDETGLVAGRSTFGEELLKVWRPDQLENTGPWRWRDAVFGVDWH